MFMENTFLDNDLEFLLFKKTCPFLSIQNSEKEWMRDLYEHQTLARVNSIDYGSNQNKQLEKSSSKKIQDPYYLEDTFNLSSLVKPKLQTQISTCQLEYYLSDIEATENQTTDSFVQEQKNSSFLSLELEDKEEKVIFQNSNFTLQPLFQLLQKFFKGQPIASNDLQLDTIQISIFKSILKRKYKTLEFIDQDKISLSDILKKMESETSRKRPEENMKFILKRTLKKLKKNLKCKLPPRTKKKDLDLYFLNHYFEKFMKQNHPPKDSIKSFLENFAVPKTINNQFISSIIKSQLLMQDFKDYIKTSFNSDYDKIINFKLNFLSKRWEEQFKNNSSQTLEQICSYIENNKKCKLPWDSKEIEEAKAIVINQLRDCQLIRYHFIYFNSTIQQLIMENKEYKNILGSTNMSQLSDIMDFQSILKRL